MKRHAIVLACALVLLSTSITKAQFPPFFFMPADRTINTPNFGGSVTLIAGYEKLETGTFNSFVNPSSPTISIVDPGSIPSRPLFAYNATTVVVDNALVRDLTMNNGSTLIMSNGAIANTIFMNNESKFQFLGGTVFSVSATNTSQVTMSSGQIGSNSVGGGYLHVSKNAKAFMTNGSLFGGATVVEDGTLVIVDSDINGSIAAQGKGTANIQSASLTGNLVARDDGKITMNGPGDINRVEVLDRGEVSISNIEARGDVIVSDGSFVADSATIVGRLVAGFDATALLSNGTRVGGVTAFDTATIILHDGLISGGVIVDDDAVVTLTKTPMDRIETNDNGTLNVEDANINGSLTANGRSRVNLDSVGAQTNVYAYGSSTITIGGNSQFASDIYALDTSSIIMTSGNVSGGLFSLVDSTIQMMGGSARIGNASSSSTLIVSGGTIFENLTADFQGTANLFGGSVGGDLVVSDAATISMFGGILGGRVRLTGNGTFNHRGGTIRAGDLPPPGGGGGELVQLLDDSAIGQGSGSMLIPGLIAYDNSTINIFGAGLTATLVDPNFEDMFSVYELTGKLADGTPLAGQFFSILNGTGASFQLIEVPEPGGITMLCIAAFGLVVRPRQRESF